MTSMRLPLHIVGVLGGVEGKEVLLLVLLDEVEGVLELHLQYVLSWNEWLLAYYVLFVFGVSLQFRFKFLSIVVLDWCILELVEVATFRSYTYVHIPPFSFVIAF